jgi:hypothetical protein
MVRQREEGRQTRNGGVAFQEGLSGARFIFEVPEKEIDRVNRFA